VIGASILKLGNGRGANKNHNIWGKSQESGKGREERLAGKENCAKKGVLNYRYGGGRNIPNEGWLKRVRRKVTSMHPLQEDDFHKGGASGVVAHRSFKL